MGKEHNAIVDVEHTTIVDIRGVFAGQWRGAEKEPEQGPDGIGEIDRAIGIGITIGVSTHDGPCECLPSPQEEHRQNEEKLFHNVSPHKNRL